MEKKKKRIRRTPEQIAKDNALKEQSKSIGLGDVVEAITTVTGIKSLVKFIAGEDCGCDERKERLNNLFSARKQPKNCLTETQYNYLGTFFALNSKGTIKLKPSEQNELNKIHSHVFNVRNEMSNCEGCVRKIVSELKTIYDNYEVQE